MNEVATAEAVAAIWFTVFFGLCLLVPAFRTVPAKRREGDDN